MTIKKIVKRWIDNLATPKNAEKFAILSLVLGVISLLTSIFCIIRAINQHS